MPRRSILGSVYRSSAQPRSWAAAPRTSLARLLWKWLRGDLYRLELRRRKRARLQRAFGVGRRHQWADLYRLDVQFAGGFDPWDTNLHPKGATYRSIILVWIVANAFQLLRLLCGIRS